jgi:hypothetical protein
VAVKEDDEHASRVRKLALVLFLVLVVSLTTAVLAGGSGSLHVTGWLLLPAGFGIVGTIQILRHPERVGRLLSGNEFDEIIAQGGLDLSAGDARGGPRSIQERLALQDALDSVRMQRGPRSLRVGGRIAGGVGTLGWFGGAIASVTVGNDLVSAGICLVAAAACAAFTVYLIRAGKRLQVAERILEGQVLSLGTPDTSPPPLHE